MSILGDRLKKLREERDWSQKYVSELLGMKRSSTYANWEYGLRDPDTETLVKLAKIFEVTTDYLTGASDHAQAGVGLREELDELDKQLLHEIRALSKADKEYVLGFIKKIKKQIT